MFLQFNLFLTVLVVISGINVNTFFSGSDVTLFILNMIPFHYCFATQRKIIDHVIYWGARQKGGNLILDEGNLIFTSRLPDGQPGGGGGTHYILGNG